MQDALGNELNVGDTVAMIYHSWLVKGKVIEINHVDKYRRQSDAKQCFGKVTVQPQNVYPNAPHLDPESRKVDPTRVVLIKKRGVTMKASATVRSGGGNSHDEWMHD